MNYIAERFLTRSRVRRKVLQRLSEPVHLNLISLLVRLFGSYRAKVEFDLVVRQQFAFPILHAADLAKKNGVEKVTVIEFGVADGAGLGIMCRLAERTTKATGIEFDVVGFDREGGLPKPVDHRDHPEIWHEGEFTNDFDKVRRSLPGNGRLIIGDIKDTVRPFLEAVDPAAPIGFISVDVDYYTSAKACLDVLLGPSHKYLPTVCVYLDDIGVETANPWCGELLAVNEFNDEHELRKIAPFPHLRHHRLFKNVDWIDQMFTAHIFDHAERQGRTT